eukprot:s1948_g4.t1
MTSTMNYSAINGELLNIGPGHPNANEGYYKNLERLVKEEVQNLGYALRIKEVAGSRFEMHTVALVDRLQKCATDANDIPDDIRRKVQVSQHKRHQKARSVCIKAITEFATKMSDIQGGTAMDASEAHRFEQWREPLEFGDGRLPEEEVLTREKSPEWLSDDEQEVIEVEEDEDEDEQEDRPLRGATPIQPKRMPRPPDTPPPRGAASSSSGARGSQEPNADDPNYVPNDEWIGRRYPSGIESIVHTGRGYINRDTRTKLLTAGNIYVPSLVEGPHATRTCGVKLQWRQYLGRLAFYSAVMYGVVSETVLQDEVTRDSDQEWLRLYHYLVVHTDIVRCKAYPFVEVLIWEQRPF